jgi:hypothetical protein
MIVKVSLHVDRQELYEWLDENSYTEEDMLDDPDILLREYLGDIVAPYVVDIEI